MLGQEMKPEPGVSVLIGVTGNSGCGQSTAAAALEGLADGVCSLDILGHRMLEKGFVTKELSRSFGMPEMAGMVAPELRRTLSGMVFDGSNRLQALNSVVHPRMVRWARMTARRARVQGGVWVLEGALLFELGLAELFDSTVVVKDTFERCSRRIYEMDGIPPEVTRRRWESQMDLDGKAAMADHVIENSGGPQYLQERMITIFHLILKTLNRI
ncbi:MAG: hypothetical protein AVO35_04325 [Candidatus Aegiribacteria sp. MLS_C]|nr:MAG: hypothetical protein AVO35_04325 [Candidatus Aegiribacteria sp. MLS_C]